MLGRSLTKLVVTENKVTIWQNGAATGASRDVVFKRVESTSPLQQFLVWSVGSRHRHDPRLPVRTAWESGGLFAIRGNPFPILVPSHTRNQIPDFTVRAEEWDQSSGVLSQGYESTFRSNLFKYGPSTLRNHACLTK